MMIFFLFFIGTFLPLPQVYKNHKDTVRFVFYIKGGPLKYRKYFENKKFKIVFDDIDSIIPFSSRLFHGIVDNYSIYKEKGEIVLEVGVGEYCRKYRIYNHSEKFVLILWGKTPFEKEEREELEPEEKEVERKSEETLKLRKIEVIVVDPGHGGEDYGAVGRRGTKEKDINLKVAKYLKKELEKRSFKVYLTRNRDIFIPLRKRTEFSNKVGADVFISLHCNASRRITKTSHGVEVYFLSEAKTDWERAVAALENASLKYEFPDQKIPDDLVEVILMDMAQTEFLYESQKLAEILQESLSEKTEMFNRGVKQANFYVLNGCYSAAVLVEMGFITTPKDERKLRKESFQKKIAEAIAEGILKFKHLIEKKN